MKEIKLKQLELSVYYEKLKNGLEVYLIPYSNKNNYYMTYATRYGSVTTEFVPIGKKKMITVPNGIAHFLEHKMFEQPDGVDPFSFFNQSGTMANASTTFDNTQYLCSGTRSLEENLDYLLEYVNTPYFTDENVEKEKGIIAEEIKMYDDMPEWVMERTLRECVFKEHPMRIDIAGSVEDIRKITKENLYDCYHSFYQPSNMFLIVAGPQDVEKTLDVVKKRMEKIDVPTNQKIKTKEYREPVSVAEKEKTIFMNIELPKVGICFKFDRSKFPMKDPYVQDLYFQMFVTLTFGITSMFREKARKEKWMSSFYTQVDDCENYKLLSLVAETKEPDIFQKEVLKALENIKITKEDVERMKKVWISSEHKMIDMVETTVLNLYDDLMKYHRIEENKMELIKAIEKKELDKLIQKLDFENRTVVKILPKKA